MEYDIKSLYFIKNKIGKLKFFYVWLMPGYINDVFSRSKKEKE